MFALAAAFVTGRDTSITLALKIAVYPWMITFALQNIRYNKDALVRVLYCLFIASSVIITIMYFQERFGVFNFSVEYAISKDRTSGFFFMDEGITVGPTTIASMILLCILILNQLLRFSTKHFKLILPLLIIYFLLLVMSGGRMAIIATFSALAFNLSLIKKNIFMKYFVVASGLILFLCLIYFFFIFQKNLAILPDSFFDRMSLSLTNLHDKSVTTRIFLWGDALGMFLDNWWGYGYDYFSNRFVRSTHNELLGQIVGIGFIGTLFYLLIYIYFFKRNIEMLNMFQKEVIFFPILTISLLISLFFIGMSENYSYSSNNILYPLVWVILGVSNGLKKHY
jgi:O-antigen ligase